MLKTLLSVVGLGVLGYGVKTQYLDKMPRNGDLAMVPLTKLSVPGQFQPAALATFAKADGLVQVGIFRVNGAVIQGNVAGITVEFAKDSIVSLSRNGKQV